MANRYIPFGYDVTDGEVRIVERESEIVKNVYALYIQGLTLIEIADRLNMLTISYASDGRAWDKNIVKRMLENKKYVGDKGYPVIISAETAELAQKSKELRYKQPSQEERCRVDAYRAKSQCGICGSHMVRQHAGSGAKRKIYWKCSNAECNGHRHVLNEKRFNTAIADLLNDVSEDLTIIELETEKDYEKDISVVHANNAVAEAMENPKSEIGMVIEKILDLAATKFQLCKAGDNSAITEKIKEIMALYAKKPVADSNTIEKVIRKIRIFPNKDIAVELINGKVLEAKNK